MKILSWNVRGTGHPDKRRGIKSLVCKINLDLLIIQELKKSKVDRNFIGSIWSSRFKEWVILPSVGSAGGIAIIWDARRVSVVDSLIGNFSVSIKIENGDLSWWMSGIYGPNRSNGREDFWDELAGLGAICGPRWCLGGDFNVVRFAREKNKPVRARRSMRMFNEIISELSLIDPPLANGDYTWSNFRDNPTCSRIDRFLFTAEWRGMFSYGLQEAQLRGVSDHFPLTFSTEPAKWGPGPFRLDNDWLEHPDFKALVVSSWEEPAPVGWPGHRIMGKFYALKNKIKAWAAGEREKRLGEKCKIERDLSRLDKLEGGPDWNEDKRLERALLKGKLDEILVAEERASRFKAKISWAKFGDGNTGLFHALLSARKAKNSIWKLEKDDGTITVNEAEIVEEINRFFEALYRAAPTRRGEWNDIDWQPVDEENAECLTLPFEEEEIKKAIFGCERNKSPGPDGFSMAFLQDFWGIIKRDVISFFTEFWESGIINKSVNETFICLIPKKSNACRAKDFRPISLVTCLYKVLAKVLAERIKKVLDKTISKFQGAFVKGRQICDLILIANELVEETRRTNKKGVVFKIDFEKAYDMVDWNFLDFVMGKKGFNNRWRKWIKGCISSVSFSIIINGRDRRHFSSTRGLRQGDPLSPFLFILVADAMSRRIQRGTTNGSFRALSVGNPSLPISHLQFADDTLIFGEIEVNNWTSLILILNSFCEDSGLKINIEKSSVVGINCDPEVCEVLAGSIGCRKVEWPISYLGMPLGHNPRGKSFWDPVISKVEKRLAGWKRGFLSKGGKLVLIQSVLSALPIYFMSVFKMPIGVAVELEKIMRRFLWEGFDSNNGRSAVAWDVCCKPKEKGGLGIGSLVHKNKALLSKWLWRFPLELEALWHKLIFAIYGLQANGWDPGFASNRTLRSPWKSVNTVQEAFYNRCRWMVGDGGTTRFWEDKWCGNESFEQRFPGLFRLSQLKQRYISNFATYDQELTGWDLQFPRNLSDREAEEFATLLFAMESVILYEGVADRRAWNDESEDFSVKSMTAALDPSNSAPSVPFYEAIWKSAAPKKVQIFGWRVALKRINTADRVQKQNPHILLSPSLCVLCQSANEDIRHLFVDCPAATGLWRWFFSKIGIPLSSVILLADFFGLHSIPGKNERWKELVKTGVLAGLWTIWIRRNKCIFEDEEWSPEGLREAFSLNIALWLHASSKEFKHFSLADLQRDWGSAL